MTEHAVERCGTGAGWRAEAPLRSRLQAALARRMLSTQGGVGIDLAVERADAVLPRLADEIARYRAGGDIHRLRRFLEEAIRCIDAYDLRPADVPLRTDAPVQPEQTGAFRDVATQARILGALVEAAEPPDDVDRLLRALAYSRNRRERRGADYYAALALAERLVEQDNAGGALAVLAGNFAVTTTCIATQYVAYKAHARAAQTGRRVEAPFLDAADLSDRFCSMPFETLSTYPIGRLNRPELFACACPGTMPYPISAGTTNATLHEVWNGPEIQELRRSILDGDFKYCNRMNCGALVSGQLPRKSDVADPAMRDIIDNHRTTVAHAPRYVTLSHDASCNLACPSCRSSIITAKNEERERSDEFADRVLLPLISDSDVMLNICGDGDPLASKHYRRLIYSLDRERHKGVKLRLMTNGLLLTPREWESLGHIRDMIISISVSIDAAAAATYEHVRRPGKWTNIVANMEHLASLLEKEPYKFYLSVNFVVQAANFREMPEFVRLGKMWRAHRVLFLRFVKLDIGGSSGTSDQQDVADPMHPDHAELMAIMREPIMRDPIVDMFTLSPLADRAVEAAA